MDDDFEDLETELKRLQPRRVSESTWNRIEQQLSRSRSHASVGKQAAARWSWRWMLWPLGFATAAMTAVMVIQPGGNDRESLPRKTILPTRIAANATTNVYQPVRVDNLLIGAAEEGRLTMPDGTPARRIRTEYVDTITWKNPQTNAWVRWSVPREEVRIVPVNYQ